MEVWGFREKRILQKVVGCAASPSREAVIGALGNCYGPCCRECRISIVEMVLTTGWCPFASRLPEMAVAEVGALPTVFGVVDIGIVKGEEESTRMSNLPRIETMEQAREVLLGMSEGQEITAELDEWRASIKKRGDAEFSAEFPEQETGTISLLDASRILLEYGDHDLYLGSTVR